MNGFLKVALVIAGACSVAPVWSQALQFKDVASLAVANSPTIKARERDLEAANSALNGAEWLRYPAMTVTLATQPSGAEGNTLPTGTGSQTSMLRVEQPLYAWGGIDARIRTSSLQRDVAAFTVQTETNTVLDRVIGAFGQMQQAQERIVVQQNSLKRLKDFDAMMARRFETQIGSRNDVALVTSRMRQAESDLVQSRALRERSRAALEEITGSAIPEVVTQKPYSLNFNSLDAVQLTVLDAAVELRNARVQRDIAEAQVEQRTADIFPKLMARVERIHSASTNLPAMDYTQAYVVLEGALGNGLAQLDGVRESSAKVLAAEQQVEATRRGLLQAVTSAWTDYKSYEEQLPNLQDITQQNEEIVESFLRQYIAGKKSWLEVLNQERELTQSRLALIDTLTSAVSTANKILRLTGQLMPAAATPAAALPAATQEMSK
jgi:adhesin transport system outer membrane protein